MQNRACRLKGLSDCSTALENWISVCGSAGGDLWRKPGILQKALVICHFSLVQGCNNGPISVGFWRKAKLLLLVMPRRGYDSFCLASEAHDRDPGSICSCEGTCRLLLLMASRLRTPVTGIQQWSSTGWSWCCENETSPTSTRSLEWCKTFCHLKNMKSGITIPVHCCLVLSIHPPLISSPLWDAKKVCRDQGVVLCRVRNWIFNFHVNVPGALTPLCLLSWPGCDCPGWCGGWTTSRWGCEFSSPGSPDLCPACKRIFTGDEADKNRWL